MKITEKIKSQIHAIQSNHNYIFPPLFFDRQNENLSFLAEQSFLLHFKQIVSFLFQSRKTNQKAPLACRLLRAVIPHF